MISVSEYQAQSSLNLSCFGLVNKESQTEKHVLTKQRDTSPPSKKKGKCSLLRCADGQLHRKPPHFASARCMRAPFTERTGAGLIITAQQLEDYIYRLGEAGHLYKGAHSSDQVSTGSEAYLNVLSVAFQTWAESLHQKVLSTWRSYHSLRGLYANHGAFTFPPAHLPTNSPCSTFSLFFFFTFCISLHFYLVWFLL